MEHPSAAQNMCILVVSCDKYADCWEPFSLCLQKFWPDCPYPVYLATETKEAPAHTIYKKVLHSSNPSWTGRLREVCYQIHESNILLTLEDHWFANFVDSNAISNIAQLVDRTSDIGVVYLDYPIRKGNPWSGNSNYNVIPPNTPYRLSAGPSIWRKEFLLIACAEDADAWNFERIKSFAPSTFSFTVLSCVDSYYCRVHPAGAIQRGKWQSFIPSFCKKNSLPINLANRETMSPFDNLKISLKSFIYNLNPPLIVKVQNWLYHLQHKAK